MKLNGPLCFALLMLAFPVFFPAQAGEPIVRGRTTRTIQRGSDFFYEELPNVSIQAYRQGPLLPSPGTSSDSKGAFEFHVPAGSPFKVLFWMDSNTVPEMQNLSGQDGITHSFEISLWRMQQYKMMERLGTVQPLKLKLQLILASLPKGDPYQERILGMLKSING